MAKIRIQNTTEPTTPPTDRTTIFVDTADKHLKIKDDTGLVTDVTGIGVTDHGALTGLADDDHLQYLNETRHDALPSDNPHGVTAAQVGNTTAQWNADQLQGEDVATAAPANGNVLTYNSGTTEWEPAAPVTGVTDHGALTGLADDDHLQYLNETRHDALPADNPHSVTAAQVGAPPTSRTLTAGDGLSGGGDLSADRTFDVDINSETSVAAASGDELLIADVSDSNNIKKVTAQSIADLASGGAPTQEVFFPSDWGSNLGEFRTRNVGSTATFRHNFWVPVDFTTITALEAIAINSGVTVASGDIDLFSEYGAVGQDFDTHAESDLAFTRSFTGTDQQIVNIDLTSVFTSLAAGDYCGVQIDHNGLGGTLGYIGIRLKYS